ncbi:hypothetical protein C2G38_2211050 [Gigaspora rosea]|uniref:Protein kinase domain-containing protein n=1 Tax=Gigaspora rosea TaxID=44941 RepID=A0A397UEQ8_9GLOM|nr:hypothetical protein C2G38_2211050 [Gigaspora rosea]
MFIPIYFCITITKEFRNWTSENHNIDQLIQQIQLNASKFKDINEWIPFSKFTNMKYLAKGGFGTVFKTGLDNSKGIKQEFLEEVKNQHKHGGDSAIAIME